MARRQRFGPGCILLLFILLSVSVNAQLLNPVESYTRADTLRGMLTHLRTCYDISFYHLDIRVDPTRKHISGSNLFRFKATADFNQLQFDLFDNLKIEKVIYKGEELSYRRLFNAVFLDFPQIIKKGSLDEFTVYYSGKPVIAKNPPWDGGFIFDKSSDGTPWVAVSCQGLGASSWWPNKDHQSDEVDSMLISVSTPAGLTDISNGRLRSVEQLADGYVRHNWFVSYPINNYNVTVNIGRFEHFSNTYVGEEGKLSLDYYVLPENLSKAQAHFPADVKPMLQCFEHWFGPYPFYRDGYKLVEAPYLGMEHQSAVAYGNHYQKGYLGRDLSATALGMDWDYLIVHESGHEWFGNNITSKDIADMWIHEAFTTYSEGLFVECRHGKEAGAKYIKGERKAVVNDVPVIGPYDVNKEGSGDMYFKGTNMLHAIRTVINNDEKWRTILRGLNKTFGLQTVTTAQITGYINKEAGRDFTPVFDQYLRYTSIPTLEIRRKRRSKSFSYRWKASVKNFNMPVRIRCGEPDSANWFFISPTTTWQTADLPVKEGKIGVDTDNFYINTRFF